MKTRRPFALISMLALLASVTLARADWFIVENPATGLPEAVWSGSEAGRGTAVLYSSLDSSGWANSTVLSGAGEEGSAPVLAFGADGGRAAAWGTFEETGRILLRMRAPSEESWSAALEVSDSAEASSSPSVVVSGGFTFVSFEVVEPTGGRSVKVSKTDPGADVMRTLVATSPSANPLVTKLHAEEEAVWVDWIDSGSSLGYCVWQDGGWSSVSYEPYEGAADIEAGRDRIRSHVLTGQ